MYAQTSRVRKRTGGGIAGTDYVNEVADAINGGHTLPDTNRDSDLLHGRHIPVTIISSTRDGANWRYIYTVQMVKPSGTNPFTFWVATGSALTHKAYNQAEMMNGSTGLTGTGVDITAEPASIMPVPAGRKPVWCTAYGYGDNFHWEFCVENYVKFAC